MKFIRYFDRCAWIRFTACQMASVLELALLRRGRAVMIAAGGSTPADIYAELAKSELDWSRVTVIPSDERWVDETSERSNIAMIKAGFCAHGKVEADFRALFVPGRSAESASPKLSERLRDAIPADLCVLGMGEDMHTASLFPNAPELGAAMAENAPAVMPARMPGTGEERVTLTMPALKNSEHIFLLIKGAGKRLALDAALASMDPLSSPVYPFLEYAEIHYLD